MAVVCYINGKPAYPSLKNAIKVTKENPFLHNDDAKTLDVEFPMEIAENLLIFGPVHRIDVSKKLEPFDDCRLMVDNIPVIRGSGRVTEITQDAVKLQILSGSNNLRYRSIFDNIYIDRLTYPTVSSRFRPNPSTKGGDASSLIDVTSDIQGQGYIGNPRQYVFMPVIDATNDCVANEIVAYGQSPLGVTTTDNLNKLALFNRAVQPNFMMVFETAIRAAGYTIKENEYNVAPWNDLVICSARQTIVIANTLPHWKVSTLLDEFRKLFNAAYIFDEDEKSVRIVHASRLADSETVEYETAEEMTSSYDEDGIEYLGSSNIKYNMSGLGSEVDSIPEDVFREFDVLEYDSYDALALAFGRMGTKDRLTHLFVFPAGYIYGFEDTETVDGEEVKTGQINMKRAGIFTPLIRDSQSDTYVELNICPVSMDKEEKTAHTTMVATSYGKYLGVNEFGDKANFFLPIIDNEQGNAYADDDERDYVSIQDVIESGESAKAEETDETSTIQLMWVTGIAYRWFPDDEFARVLQTPMSTTDFFICGNLPISLALTHGAGRTNIGSFHERVIKINAGQSVDANNEVLVSFLCDGIPDVNKIFSFHNKRYLCSKVEIEVTGDGIERLKKGYFYELLE